MQNDRELDQIIDAALPGYSEAEPRPGMEQRILAQSLAEEPSNRRFLWVWTAAVPTVACVLVLLFLFARHRPAESIGQVGIQPQTPAIAPGHQQNPLTAASHLRRRKAKPPVSNVASALQKQALPKKDIFPTPSPITPEEERMLAFTNSRVPIPTQTAVVGDIPPLDIAEVNIKPFNRAETETTPTTPRPQQP